MARQYTGTAGQVTNCQVTVHCHYAERTLAWPVATGLYLPQAWAEDAARRQQAHGPEGVPFQTKAELALVLLAEAKACGVRHACVTCEADYGDNPQEAKTELGWEQYQGRRWDGFHRHALTVRLSYSFLVWLQGRAREHRKVSGRPRAAFSPSPGPPRAAEVHRRVSE